MKLTLASIATRAAGEPYEAMVAEYMGRTRPYLPIESVTFKTSAAFFDTMERQRSRMGSLLVLLDGRGRQFSSEELAQWLGRMRDEGQQRVVFAIGPADGWSVAERTRAALLLSLGPMTLPHELARVVISEQVYRAFTILAGHPYHTGH